MSRRLSLAVAWVVSLGAAAATLALVVGMMGHSLDWSDEGFYLTWISHPGDVDVGYTFFGHVYHPLYLLVGGDIHALRVAGALLTVAAGAALAWTVLSEPLLSGVLARGPYAARLGLSLLTGLTGLVWYSMLPLSPSYNTLAFQALCVAWAGLVLGAFRRGRVRDAGWALVGVGGWLAFLAKPTAGALLLPLVVVVALVLRVVTLRAVAVTAGATLAAAAATLGLTGQSPARFVERLRLGQEVVALVDGHDPATLFRWQAFPFQGADWLFALPLAALAVLGSLLLGRPGVRTWLGAAAVAAAAGCAAYGIVLLGERELFRPWPFYGPVLLWAIPVVLLVATAAHWRRLADARPPRGVLPVVIGLSLTPLAGSFGTNNNIWWAQAHYATFWLVAGLALLGATRGARREWPVALAPALTAAALAAVVTAGTLWHPYRGLPMSAADVPTVVDQSGSVLRLGPEEARQARGLLGLGEGLGIDESVRMIDLTGDSPGWIHALGARPVGDAWILGGYRGSDLGAITTLRRADCRAVRDAWLLVSPDNRRRLDVVRVLAGLGTSLGNYERVGTFDRPGRSSRTWPRRPYPVDDVKVYIYRPLQVESAALPCPFPPLGPGVPGWRGTPPPVPDEG